MSRNAKFVVGVVTALLLVCVCGAVATFGLLGAAGVWLASSQVTLGGQVLNSENVSQSLQGATSAEVQIAPDAATLHLGSMQGMNRADLSPDLLIIGTVSMTRNERVTRDFQLTGNTARFVLRNQGQPTFSFSSPSSNPAWNLSLTPAVPVRLRVSLGAGDAQIDLTRLNVTSLDLSTGVGRTVVNLPAHGRFQANISGGVGEVTVRIPSGLSARIHVSAGLGSTDISGVYPRQGNIYMSPGFDAAADRVDLEVSAGIGKATVQDVKSP